MRNTDFTLLFEQTSYDAMYVLFKNDFNKIFADGKWNIVIKLSLWSIIQVNKIVIEWNEIWL